MAVVVVSQIPAQIVGLPYSDPTDVESDSNTAPEGDLNVVIPPQAGTAGYITLSPEASSVLAELTNGPCSVTVTQGSGSVTLTMTQ